MARLLACLLALAAPPALALFGIETDPDKIQAQWKRESLEALATSRDAGERRKAAEWLGGRDDAESIAALGNALADPEAKVRQAAASGLWKSGKAAAPARAPLAKALDDPDPNVVAQAAGALQSIGARPEELLAARKRVFAASDATPDSRFLVARNLVGHEPGPRLLEPMLAFLERAAAQRDGRHNAELAQKALARLAKSQDRAVIAPLMAAARGSRAVPVLLETLAIFQPRPEGYLDFVLAFLAAPDPKVRDAALTRLRDLTAEDEVATWAPRAAALLEDADASVRSEALWALGNARGLAGSQIEKVVARLGDPREGVRRSAAYAIGNIGEAQQAIPAALMARIAAAALPALTAAMEKDPDKDVRSEAKSALAKLGAARLAAVAPASAAGESGGMALLRARNIGFEEGAYFRALSEVDVEVVRAFLDAGMSPRAQVAGMGGPIRAMLFGGNACQPQVRPTDPKTKAMVRMLLERGAEADAADAHGNTALMEAASKGCDRELIGMLIKAGATIGARNAAGLTPFEMGLYIGHDGLEELIAAGYRLPPDKAKAYADGYQGQPAAQAMIRKATARR